MKLVTRLAYIPHKCPVCDGQGIVSKPPWVAGDQEIWVDNVTSHPCKACNGTGIIWADFSTVIDNDGKQVADTRGIVGAFFNATSRNQRERHANARLIAAAPDREKLKEVRWRLRGLVTTWSMWPEAANFILTIIRDLDVYLAQGGEDGSDK